MDTNFNNSPLISIIVPVYNQEKNIQRCLDSILAQSYSNLEIIVIDDGSTDSSWHIICDYSANDFRIKPIHSINGGVSSARNIGIEACTGAYISFVDADDFVSSDYVKTLLDNAIQYHRNVSICDYREVSPEDYGTESTENTVIDINIYNDYGYQYEKSNYLFPIWGKLISRELIDNIRFDTSITLGEDTLFFAQVLSKDPHAILSYAQLYNYVIYGSSASHGVLSESKLSVLIARIQMIDILHSAPDSFQKGLFQFLGNETVALFVKYYLDKTNNKHILSSIKKHGKIIKKRYIHSGISWIQRIKFLALLWLPEFISKVISSIYAKIFLKEI